MLQDILGQDLYFQLLEEMGKYEMEGRLTLPLTDLDVFTEIWHKVKAELRLGKANFDENSFLLKEIKISLGPRPNYFLADDLAKLSQLTEEGLNKTALSSWAVDEELNIASDVPHEKDLYFPFLYDKYQIQTLSLIGNKAAIIQGPPGTGKSETIANILCHLAATGNRVLFVSQKAQALKVVKDKLKKLDVKYLYGYLPNPNSAQVGEGDEADGIAPQLSALGSHIERISLKSYSDSKMALYISDEEASGPIASAVEKKSNLQQKFNEIIDNERKFYQLHQELDDLKDYDVNISNMEAFGQNLTDFVYEDLKKLKAGIESLERIIKDYEVENEKKKYDKLFKSLDFAGKHFSEPVRKLRDDIVKTGYDGHSNFLRKFNKTFRTFRLRGTYRQLPREIVDNVNGIFDKDLSRNDTIKQFGSLYNYCFYYENTDGLKDNKSKLEQGLKYCGLSIEDLENLANIENGKRDINFSELKEKILHVQEIKNTLLKLSKSESANQVSSAIKRANQERVNRVGLYIQNIVNKKILQQWKQGVSIKQIIRKLASAFGKSKKAFKTFDDLRKDPNNFKSILDLIPIWIMELDDASRIIPLEIGMFDYVILDEASQCNVAYTLPIMYRSKRALFVGDSEQMRDTTIMFKSNRVFDELAHRYSIPEERQIKATGSAVQSVLDIAYKRGFNEKPLRYYYRSPAELIEFSNKYFYRPKGKELIPLNNNYLTYKDTNRIIVIHEVKSDGKEEFSDNVSVAEANEILGLFKELRDDERYENKSIGILSFFNAQASYLRELFEKEGFKEEEDNYKISIIEGIQGDEKDIIIYSFVIRTPEQKNRYTPLTGESGDIRADINRGRVNVAFSRARLQVHCFVSMSPADIPDKIWLKKYLEYVQENGELDFVNADLKPFDSYFEEDFFNLMHSQFKHNYKIQNQVESCGFKIDFVISNSKTNKKIAIECDGPTHFKNEVNEAYGIYVESDEERQRILETVGWKFCRIKYSDWIDEKFDRDTVVEVLKQLLD
jgi:very-short-patch-repair endonuclease